MATKRFFGELESDPDQQLEKRTRTRPTLASIISEVRIQNSLQHLCTALEPMLRRVVTEEVENGLRHCTRSLTRAPSVRIQALEPSNLQLKFVKELGLPIFTGSKIIDIDGSPLSIIIVKDGQNLPVTLLGPIKVELVVLDGDFPPEDRENWTAEEFDGSIARERLGKRPLLAGDVSITMRNSCATIGDIELTDNSSWVRSRKFRIGARVVPGSHQGGARIIEAITEAFVVRDHRGELYKKHYPPSLNDDVWRLEKIGKDGAFHKKLVSEGIKTVQDFLKMSVVDTPKLREILGAGMSEKTWEATIKHAKTCGMGNKHYVYSHNNWTIILNPICQVERAMVDGRTYTAKELSSINTTYIENLVRQAYSNWGSLQEFEGLVNELALLPQGEVEDPNPLCNEAAADKSMTFQHGGNQSSRTTFEIGYFPVPNSSSSNNNSVQQVGISDWQMTYFMNTPEHAIG
ncbi:hypothetical protein SAY86_016637 [Trapa natans]|uniref:Protein SAR DEFICIENT 1 n=1 Tax=Trapa natans TaxID=22666 RepID=A0AAN7LCK6_TRANT|nr:hypothetical protein SAY86_016637 [Trapa natans]